MGKSFVINSGSSSVKFKIYDYDTEKVISSGIIERIGLEKGLLEIKYHDKKIVKEMKIDDHENGIKLLLDTLQEEKIISDLNEIINAGHRVVQGADVFHESVIVEQKELKQIKDLASLAPLHNIPNALGIETFQKLLPDIKNIAVFDTEFHGTLPIESYMYAIPKKWYEKHKVRRFGAHGTSHKYVTEKASKILKIKKEQANYIICHLGNGASITAVKNGKSIQTSMGLTPLEGLVMGTRSGDIDPSIFEYIEKQENLNTKEVTNILNKESGMKALSGVSSDMRDIIAAIDEGNIDASNALKVYCTRILEYIGSYFVRLGGVDAICFTAGVGENTPLVRKMVLENLDFLGLKIDDDKNNKNDVIISTEDSKIKAMVVQTDEEYQILKEIKKLC